jgi:hypothetical protein
MKKINFNEHKELIQQFANTFNLSKVDIYNFVMDAAQDKEVYDFTKGLEKTIAELSEKYRNQFIKLDTEYIRLEKIEINEYNICVRGVGIEFYDDCDYREEIELTYENWWFLMGVEIHKTTREKVEEKLQSMLVDKAEMNRIFGENFDIFHKRFRNRFFNITEDEDATEANDEWILCSAIKRKQPRECTPYYEGTNDICAVELGYRHHDIFHRFENEMDEPEQGFYTSKGRYVNRAEAAKIAYAAGQIKEPTDKLFSEDLY